MLREKQQLPDAVLGSEINHQKIWHRREVGLQGRVKETTEEGKERGKEKLVVQAYIASDSPKPPRVHNCWECQRWIWYIKGYPGFQD